METDENSLPPISLEDKRAIALPAWCTAKSRRLGIFELTDSFAGASAHWPHSSCRFLEYLRADGVFLPATVADPPVRGDVEGEELDWGDSNAQSGTGASPENSLNFDLTDVQTAIGSALQELSPSGNGVFLKTNWSAPKDASFLIGSLQVQAIADVLTMLKSSSCTALDLDACAATGCTPVLCLRTFVAIPPQNEFRVFFVSSVPVAVSQRHVHQFYPHLPLEISEWRQRIQKFCALLSPKLPLPTCVIDIAFTEQSPKGIVVDVDAFCSDTSALLFSPRDILAAASAATAAQHSGAPFQFEFRVLQTDAGLQPSPAMYYGLPLDLQSPDVESAVLKVQGETS